MEDDVGQKLITLLQYLLPGFFAAWVYYGLTPVPVPSQFERIIQALIFTLLVQPLAFVVKILCLAAGNYYSVGAWSTASDVSASIASAFFLGVVFAAFANNDGFHALMRLIRVTRETSYPSEWFNAFHDNETYVVLHLKDLRRIYGWPTIWPSVPNVGHFALGDASWLDDNNHQTPITNVSPVLVPASEVQLVEFVSQESATNGPTTEATPVAAEPAQRRGQQGPWQEPPDRREQAGTAATAATATETLDALSRRGWGSTSALTLACQSRSRGSLSVRLLESAARQRGQPARGNKS